MATALILLALGLLTAIGYLSGANAAGTASASYNYQYCTTPSQYQYCSTSTSTTTTTTPTSTSTSTTTTTTPTTTSTSTTTTTSTSTSTSTTTTTSTSTSTSTTTPPGPNCVRTLGYYKNHPQVVQQLVAQNGGTLRLGKHSGVPVNLTASQVLTVLNATGSRHPGVTVTSTTLLNLAQQVLTAELNIVSGAIPPASVTAALNTANNGIDVTFSGGNIVITTTLTQSQMNSLINTLTKFNEGKLGPRACR